MRMSKMLAATLRENPAEAEVVSHQLLVRAGYIRRLANGVYSYLPLMTRVLQKVERIVREEMDRTGAQELLMPILQPEELWQASGRWDVYGPLMMRVKDRHDRLYGLAPTAEEVITDIAAKEVRSYRQLPINLYQIQTKYRDEIRPRFGLLRGREFIMKDAYSFHATQEDLDREYAVMAEAYTRIFERCGLETRQVRSDSGAIGGSVSHEYMVLTRVAEGEQESGENDVFFCERCDYAANAERAESILPPAVTDGADVFALYGPNAEVETPGTDTIDKLCAQLKCPPSLICKALLYIKDEQEPFLVLIRGDLEAEETKVLNAVQAQEIRLANEEEIRRYFGTQKGFVGAPSDFWHTNENKEGLLHLKSSGGFIRCVKALEKSIPLLFDQSVVNLQNFVCANNKTNYHIVNVNWKEILPPESQTFDLRRARVGDICPECREGQLQMTRGIEVGNIFQLGTKYSGRMGATYTAEDGTEQPFVMGCYGIGVSRTAAAAIERFHDRNGIIWPMAIAPYQAIVVPVNVQDDTQRGLAERVYRQLREDGVEVLLDDRDERAGVKFKDADLIGIPIRVTAGKKAVEGLLEVKLRDCADALDLPVDEALAFVHRQIREWRPFAAPSPQPVA